MLVPGDRPASRDRLRLLLDKGDQTVLAEILCTAGSLLPGHVVAAKPIGAIRFAVVEVEGLGGVVRLEAELARPGRPRLFGEQGAGAAHEARVLGAGHLDLIHK